MGLDDDSIRGAYQPDIDSAITRWTQPFHVNVSYISSLISDMDVDCNYTTSSAMRISKITSTAWLAYK
jgi:hypothetical protein